jgi:protein LTV1
MPTLKKPRKKGVTYKLVPRSYGDTDGEEGPVWVSEAEFYRNHQKPTVDEQEEDRAQRQFRMYAAAANAEFKEERSRLRHHTEGGDEGVEDEEDGEYYNEADEEGEWVDGDWEDGEDGEGEWEGEWAEEEEEAVGAPPPPPSRPSTHTTAAAATATTTTKPAKKAVSFVPPAAAAAALPASASTPLASALRGRAREEKRVRDEDDEDRDIANRRGTADDENAVAEKEAEEEEEEEKLFEDEVECEVTDDFLRQLVFGNGDDGDDGALAMEDEGEDEDDWDGLDQEDGEMWRLLTDEEKAAIKASRHRGTARRRKMAGAAAGEAEGEATRTHAADGTEYPTHDVTQRALDRQFTEMMREFNADARLNDAYTDDPRTHGALPMEKYMAALEEFVTERAGMDVETAEPRKNKGLIQQLKYLSHHAGAFDSDARGTYMTTLLPEKQQRFIEEFQRGTEEIRRAARMRLAQRQQAAAAAALITSPSTLTTATTAASSSRDANQEAVTAPEATLEAEEESEEDMIVLEVKSKADRLDCETAVSAYSTYYNQPNVIQAPRKSNSARRVKKSVGMVNGNVISATGTSKTAGTTDKALSDTTLTTAGVASKQKRKAAAATARKVQLRSSSDADADSGSDVEEGNGATTAARQVLDVIPTVRPRGETKEEKKLRRQAVKAAQRERRQAKSALKSMYRDVESEEVKRNATSQAARRTVHFM